MLSRVLGNGCNRKAACTTVLKSRIDQKFCSRPGQQRLTKPEESSTTSNFLKSFGVLLEEPQRKGVVGRRDWHLWQIIVMLLPSLGVAGLAYVARRDMRIQEAKLNERKQEREAKDPEYQKAQAKQKARVQKDAQIEQDRQQQQQVQAKLEELEHAVRLMHVRQLIQDMTGSKMLPFTDADGKHGSTKSKPEADQQANERGDSPRQEVVPPQQPSLHQNPPAEVQADTDARNQAKSHADTRTNADHAADRTSEAKSLDATAGHTAASSSNIDQESSMNVNSQPTAVAAVRQFVKHQVSTLYSSVKQMFVGGQRERQQTKGHEQQDKSSQ